MQLINDIATITASLRARKPSVNLNKITTILGTLILKLPNSFTPCCITKGEGKLMIFYQILHRQILDCYQLVFSNQSSCQFVKKILTNIANFCMNFSDFQSGFMAVVRAFFLTAKSFLSLTQFTALCLECLRISNLFAITQSHQAIYT